MRDAPYRRIVADLRAAIERGELRDGDPLPSLADLCTEYQVSKATAQKAVKLAVAEGLATGQAGRGVYARVWAPVMRRMPDRYALAADGSADSVHDVDTAGRALAVDLVDVDRVPAPREVADLLGLPAGAETVRRHRVYQVDGRPASIGTSWYPADIAADTPIEQPNPGRGGTPRRLAELGHRPVEMVETVTIRPPSAAEVDDLALIEGQRVVDIMRVVVASSGRAVEVSHMVAGDATYRLVYRLRLA